MVADADREREEVKTSDWKVRRDGMKRCAGEKDVSLSLVSSLSFFLFLRLLVLLLLLPSRLVSVDRRKGVTEILVVCVVCVGPLKVWSGERVKKSLAVYLSNGGGDNQQAQHDSNRLRIKMV